MEWQTPVEEVEEAYPVAMAPQLELAAQADQV
jgi:hypothetical protein